MLNDKMMTSPFLSSTAEGKEVYPVTRDSHKLCCSGQVTQLHCGTSASVHEGQQVSDAIKTSTTTDWRQEVQKSLRYRQVKKSSKDRYEEEESEFFCFFPYKFCDH